MSAIRRHWQPRRPSHRCGARQETFDPFALRLDTAAHRGLLPRARLLRRARRLHRRQPRPGAQRASTSKSIVDEGPATDRTVNVGGLDTIGDDAKPISRQPRSAQRARNLRPPRYLVEKGEIRQRMQHARLRLGRRAGARRRRSRSPRRRRDAQADPGLKATVRLARSARRPRSTSRLVTTPALLPEGALHARSASSGARASSTTSGCSRRCELDYRTTPTSEQADVTLSRRRGAAQPVAARRSAVARVAAHGAARARRVHARPLPRRAARAAAARSSRPTWPCRRSGTPCARGRQRPRRRSSRSSICSARPTSSRHAGYDLGLEYAFQYHGPRAHARLRAQLLARPAAGRPRLRLPVPACSSTPIRRCSSIRQLVGARFGYVDPYRLGWSYQDVRSICAISRSTRTRGGYFALRPEEGGIYTGGAFDYEKLCRGARLSTARARRVDARGAHRVRADLRRRATSAARSRGASTSAGPSSHRGFNYQPAVAADPVGLPGSRRCPSAATRCS